MTTPLCPRSLSQLLMTPVKIIIFYSLLFDLDYRQSLLRDLHSTFILQLYTLVVLRVASIRRLIADLTIHSQYSQSQPSCSLSNLNFSYSNCIFSLLSHLQEQVNLLVVLQIKCSNRHYPSLQEGDFSFLAVASHHFLNN